MARPQSTPEEEGRLHSLWALFGATHDPEVRNEIIECYLPWCRSVARGMYLRRGGLPSEFGDYLQMTTLAMIECVRLFDPAQGVPFEAFALPRVRGKVFNELHALSEKHEQVFLQTRLRAQRAEALREGVGEPGAPAPRDAFEQLVQLTVGLAVAYMLEGTQLFKDESAPETAPSAYDSVEMAQQRDWMQR
jgi:RNA polymerase sigma factor FliA